MKELSFKNAELKTIARQQKNKVISWTM